MADSSFRINRGVTLNPQTSAPTNPTNGDIYYDSTLNTFVFYDSGTWINLANKTDIASAATLTSATMTASVVQSSLIAITGSNTSNLYGLLASSDGKQVLVYNGSSNPLIVNYNSGTEPTAAGKIFTYNQGSATILAGQTALLVYSSSIFSGAGGWILASSPGTGGSGSGVGDDLDALTFRASFNELFSDGPTSSASSINTSAGFTNAVYNASQTMWTMQYDATKTATATANNTSLTINTTPGGFTLTAGDVIVNLATGEVRKITVVAGTSLTLELGFTTALSAQSVILSQAVHTVDVYNFTLGGTAAALSTAFPGTTMSEFLVDYKDNNVSNSNLFTPDTGPYAGFVVSADNSSWSVLQARPALDTTQIQSVVTSTAGSSLYMRFFADQTSGTGFVNLIMYKAFMQKLASSSGGSGVTGYAYAMLNGAGTPVNSSLSVVGGKSVVTLSSFFYPVGLNSGGPYGSVDVYVNGQLAPRFISAALTPDLSYTEYSANAIQLDRDYSSQPYSVEVLYRTAVVDSSSTNLTNISNIQSSMGAGFQGFIDQTNVLVATASTGSPVAGSFHSSIVGRSNVVDFSQDLKPRMGVERIMFQDIMQLQGEFGPNNEMVYIVPNDSLNQIRLAGWWNNNLSSLSNGRGPNIGPSQNNSFIEVTFYGTGLNALLLASGTTDTVTILVDGVSLGSFTFPFNTTSVSTVISGRNTTVNMVANVVSNLSLGIHTVKMLITTANNYWTGVEIINESSSVKVQPGSSYVSGQKLALAAQSSFSYSAPVTGARGGRVLVYQKSDGTIGQAFQAVDAAQANLTSASHTNEEMYRNYNPREFGAGNGFDFSILSNDNNARSWTLDDDSTSLHGGANLRLDFSFSTTFQSLYANSAGSIIWIEFVGTGLDLLMVCDNASRTYNVSVDNTSIGSISSTGATMPPKWYKIVSGLSYGSHTVKLTASGGAAFGIVQIAAYQPKKPTLPSGAVELGDYCVLPSYVPLATADVSAIAPGVLRKAGNREVIYSGTWSATTANTSLVTGTGVNSSSAGAYLEYTFFGTGFEFRGPNNTASATVTLQSITTGGSLLSATTGNFPTMLTATNSFTFSAGTLTTNGASNGAGYSIYNLPLGLWRVRHTVASGNLNFDCFDIVTPIYSNKSNVYADLQNTLPVGSNSISDNRKLTPVKDILPSTKNWAQALPVQSPSTTSLTFVPMPDASLTMNCVRKAVEMIYISDVRSNTGNGLIIQFAVDDVLVGNQMEADTTTPSNTIANSIIVNVSPGVHKFDVMWRNGGAQTGSVGSGTNVGRIFTVKEV